jgi:hypothetical protein
MGDSQSASQQQVEATKRRHGIATSLDYYAPPQYKWRAWYGSPGWDGDPESRIDIGNGPTEESAIKDLLDNYDDPKEFSTGGNW